MSEFSKLEITLDTLGGSGTVKLDGVDISSAVNGLRIIRETDGKVVCEVSIVAELEARIEGDVTIVRWSGAGRTVLPVDGTTHKIKPADAS